VNEKPGSSSSCISACTPQYLNRRGVAFQLNDFADQHLMADAHELVPANPKRQQQQKAWKAQEQASTRRKNKEFKSREVMRCLNESTQVKAQMRLQLQSNEKSITRESIVR